MDTVDIVGLLAPITYFVFLITEKMWPARTFPPRKGWQWIGIGFLILIGAISSVTPLMIPAEWLNAHRWLDGTKLGVGGGAIVGYLLAAAGMFQHSPQWLGYLIQRPESHCVHHRLGLHYYNYSDLPIYDMLFGTFRNPRAFRGECGFENGADRELGAMLAFADVNAPLYGTRQPGCEAASCRRGSCQLKRLTFAAMDPGEYCRPNAPLRDWARRSAGRD